MILSESLRQCIFTCYESVNYTQMLSLFKGTPVKNGKNELPSTKLSLQRLQTSVRWRTC